MIMKYEFWIERQIVFLIFIPYLLEIFNINVYIINWFIFEQDKFYIGLNWYYLYFKGIYLDFVWFWNEIY